MTLNPEYTIYLTDAKGNQLEMIDDFTSDEGASFTHTQAVNSIDTLTVNLPERYWTFFQDPSKWVDYRFELFVHQGGLSERLDGDSPFFIRRRTKRVIKGIRKYRVYGYSALELCKRAHINANTTTAGGKKTGTIDNVMRAYVRENIGTSAGAGRVRPLFSVESDYGLGVTTTKEGGRRKLLELLQELAQESGTTTKPLFFDIIRLPDNTLQFEVHVNQWGRDRRASVILSSEDGTLDNVEEDFDYTDEYNSIYVGGAGQDALMAIGGPAQDATRIAISPYNLREDFVTFSVTNDTTVLANYGKSQLRNGKPKIIFTADIKETDDIGYQKEWFFGDRLSARVDGKDYFVRVDSLTVAVQNGRRDLKGLLRAEL